jgi:hypothetical protein
VHVRGVCVAAGTVHGWHAGDTANVRGVEGEVRGRDGTHAIGDSEKESDFFRGENDG